LFPSDNTKCKEKCSLINWFTIRRKGSDSHDNAKKP
jgi:hypothetical protein